MKTFGDFYDAILERTKTGGEDECHMFESEMHMECWTASVTDQEWAEARAKEICEGSAGSFANDMIILMRQRITNICTEDLYNGCMDEARRFRKIIGEVAGEFGFNLAAVVSQAVTYSEFFKQQTSIEKN